MVGDRQFTHSSGMKMTGKTKIYEIPEFTANSIFESKRVFIGFAGDTGSFGNILNWLYDPTGRVPKLGNVDLVMLNHRHEIYTAISLTNWLQMSQPFYAIGSGSEYAMGAMEAGKTPQEAIKVASKFDSSTGKGFTVLTM
jgi:ATP-dependent protease HslVU (ClpYQ) peptidase subunit